MWKDTSHCYFVFLFVLDFFFFQCKSGNDFKNKFQFPFLYFGYIVQQKLLNATDSISVIYSFNQQILQILTEQLL